MGMGGLGLSSDDDGLAAAAFAQLNTQVALLDTSPFLPGSPQLAATYSLGPCRSPTNPSTSSAWTPTSAGHMSSRGIAHASSSAPRGRSRNPVLLQNLPPPPPFPMRRGG